MAVGLGVGLGMAISVGEGVEVGAAVAVGSGVGVGMGVGMAAGCGVDVGSGVGAGMDVGTGIDVGGGVDVGYGVGVCIAVANGSGVGSGLGDGATVGAVVAVGLAGGTCVADGFGVVPTDAEAGAAVGDAASSPLQAARATRAASDTRTSAAAGNALRARPAAMLRGPISAPSQSILYTGNGDFNMAGVIALPPCRCLFRPQLPISANCVCPLFGPYR